MTDLSLWDPIQITEGENGESIQRLKIPGGWLVRVDVWDKNGTTLLSSSIGVVEDGEDGWKKPNAPQRINPNENGAGDA